jgi:hypothetical protein
MKKLAAFVLITLLAGCDLGGPVLVDPPEPPSQQPEGPVTADELADAVEHAEHVPVSLMVLGEKMPVLPVEPWERAQTTVFERDELDPLVESLRAGGFDDEQIAQLVWVGSTHNTNHPADAIGRRHAMFESSYRQAMGQFQTDLEQAAKDQGRTVDWDAARQAGIITNFGDKPL